MPAAAPGANGSSAGSQDGTPRGRHGQAASIQPYLSQQAQQTQHAQQATAPDSAYDDGESEYSTVSTFTQFLRDYSLRFWDPVVCCKLRKRYVHRPNPQVNHIKCGMCAAAIQTGLLRPAICRRDKQSPADLSPE